MHICLVSRVGHFVTPSTVALQAPLSMGFPRGEYGSGLPFPPPGDLSYPALENRVTFSLNSDKSLLDDESVDW